MPTIAKSAPMNWSHQHLDEAGSTNDWAMAGLKQHVVTHPLLVTTNHQTAGRGQRGKTWKGQRGQDLAMSLVYESDFSGPYTYTWIGGNRIDTSGAFEWTDGEPFDYTNWYSTEPTGAPDEQCIEIFYPFDASGRWNDDFCTKKFSRIKRPKKS